jgi:hypothetical protein
MEECAMEECAMEECAMEFDNACFVRRANVKHYLQLLDRATEPVERARIQQLLAEEQQKQVEAGDPPEERYF